MSRLPTEYRIILILIVLIAVPSAVLCYISIFALGREERALEERLTSSYESSLEKDVARTHERLGAEEAQIAGLVTELSQRSFILPTAWRLLADASGEEGLFRSVYLFDENGAVLFPRLHPHKAEALDGSTPPEVLGDLKDSFSACERLEFTGAVEDALEGYRELAIQAPRKAGRNGASLAAASLLGMARCYRKSRFPRRAVETLDRIVYRYPGETGTASVPLAPGALLEKAALCVDIGDPEEARRAYRDLAFYLARNQGRLRPRYYDFFRHRLLTEGGEESARELQTAGSQVREYGSFVDAFGPLVRQAVEDGQLRKDPLHLYSGNRLVFALPLLSLPESSDPKGYVAMEIDGDRVAQLFLDFTRRSGIGERVHLSRPEAEQTPSAPPLAVRAFPRPLRGWEARLLSSESSELSSLSQMRWSIYFWLIVVASAILVGGILFVIRSVSREMRLARDRSTFLSNVTHDLKTPLTSIRMFVDTLRMGRASDPADMEECLGVMAAETDRLTRLIDRVLDFSKAERGTKRYTFREIWISTIVDATLNIFRTQMVEDECELILQVPDDLPSIKADPDAIIEVLLNLLDNALKYSPEEKTITLRAGSRDGRVSLAVLDRGVGVERKNLQRIFDPFYRADDDEARAVEGTGLGLAHARRVVRDHGGDIVVESEPGRGSIFTLWLPIWKG